MRALTVDCVTNRRSAALTKLPAATTDKKVRASSVSIDEADMTWAPATLAIYAGGGKSGDSGRSPAELAAQRRALGDDQIHRHVVGLRLDRRQPSVVETDADRERARLEHRERA